jgi:23S rRNA (guanine2535-N1)-methyltransferase
LNYRYATERADYSHLASGRVFYGLPGYPALPVRLASEIFQRCLARRRASGPPVRCVLYDPCCGAGYSLSVLAFLHRAAIHTAIGSDVDEQAVQRARRNLDLLTLAGLEHRSGEIARLAADYGKASHREALGSVEFVRRQVTAQVPAYPLVTQVFQVDVTAPGAVLAHLPTAAVDIVLADIPYGQHSQWQHANEAPPGTAPLWLLLDNLRPVLAPAGVVAVVSSKAERAAHAGFRRVEHFLAGKRRVTVLEPLAP